MSTPAFKKQKTFSTSEDKKEHERIWKTIRVERSAKYWNAFAELPCDMAIPTTKRMLATEYYGDTIFGYEEIQLSLPTTTEKYFSKAWDEIIYHEIENGIDLRPKDEDDFWQCEHCDFTGCQAVVDHHELTCAECNL